MSCQTWLAAKLERCIFTFSNWYNGYDDGDDDVEMVSLFLPWPPTSSVISIIFSSNIIIIIIVFHFLSLLFQNHVSYV